MSIYNGPSSETSSNWKDRVNLLQTLTDSQAQEMIKVVYSGKVVNLSDYDRQLNAPFSGISLEITGMSHIYKSTVLTEATAQFMKLGIPVELVNEETPKFSPNIGLYEFNVAMTAIAIQKLLNRVNSSNYQARDVVSIFDRGVFNAIPFLLAQRLAENDSPGSRYSKPREEIIQNVIDDPLSILAINMGKKLDGLIMINAPADKSLSSGSTLKKFYLERLSEAFTLTPQIIAVIRKNLGLEHIPFPVAIINTDTESDLEETLIGSLGFLTQELYKGRYFREHLKLI